MAEKFSLKDFLFNKNKVSQLASEVKNVYPEFAEESFIDEVMIKFPELELKARISWIAENLKKYLPNNYSDAVAVILKALPEPNDPSLTDNDFGDFIYAPYAEFVAKYGLDRNNLTLSLNVLREITMRFSVEDAIRYFINKYPKETLETLLIWSKDSNYHVRRLCSEGTRPKLPWAQKINMSHSTPITILDNLFSDSARFVTRSVANHMNDISKVDPELVIKTLIKWRDSKKQDPKEMDYIIKHSLRTLIKQGDLGAMELLGFSHKPDIAIQNFTATNKVKMNSYLQFSFDIYAKSEVNLVVDYILYFQNKTGKLNNKKVFKIKALNLNEGETATIQKKHMLKQFMTTRTLYPGTHKLEIQINGEIFKSFEFELQ